MKFQILQSTLQAGLKTVSPAVSRSSYLPILWNVRLCATGTDLLELSATDLEARIDCRLGAKIDRPGETTVPARLLADFVATLPDERIDFALDGDSLEVACGAHKATIQCAPADEFPTAPAFGDDAHVATVPGDLFRTMLRRATVAASKDATSWPVLAGVFARFEGDGLTLAAADGFRLSVCQAEFDDRAWKPASAIVPASPLSGFGRLSGDEVQIRIVNSVKQSQARFSLERVDYTLQLIEGRFPDYGQIIPERHDTHTTVDTGELLRAVRTARIFAKHEAEIVHLNVREGGVKVSATSAEMGDVETEIDAVVDGDEKELDIAFNAGFLVEALGVMGSEKVVMLTTTKSGPAVFKPSPEPGGFTHVLMPMHVK
jgi:DNA polymerase-3 subunit beta